MKSAIAKVRESKRKLTRQRDNWKKRADIYERALIFVRAYSTRTVAEVIDHAFYKAKEGAR